MARLRLLVVDDSVVVRQAVAALLTDEDGVIVAATAANGRLAIAEIERARPDLVLLDIEMPEMDGLETLRRIRTRWPSLPVLMFSQFTRRGAGLTLQALALGANGYLAKPTTGTGNDLRATLLQKIREIVPDVPVPPPDPVGGPARVSAVVVGGSTGGPDALATLIAALPAQLPVPVLVVQHMPAEFTRVLTSRLANLRSLPIVEATHGLVPAAGRVYVGPGDQHLEVQFCDDRARLRLSRRPPENSCRPSVDVLFRTAAEVYGSGTLAVVLTGMGHDGTRGAAAVRKAGGIVLAQDEATSTVWGMPGAVVRAGLANSVLPLPQIGPVVLRQVVHGRSPSTMLASRSRLLSAIGRGGK